MNKIDKVCDTLGELIIALKDTYCPPVHIGRHKGTRHERLFELRDHLGLTQKEIAEAIGVHQVAIQKAETGKSFLKIDNLQILSDLYEVNLNWLINGEGEMFLKKNVA